MSKRKYTHLQGLMPEIKAMLDEGKSQREIEASFGLEGDRPIHNLLKRERRKERKNGALKLPTQKGRPRKGSESQEQVIRRLQMENELLRNFLSVVGRK